MTASEEREAATSNSKGGRLYKTIGRIVPIDVFIDNVNTKVIENIKD